MSLLSKLSIVVTAPLAVACAAPAEAPLRSLPDPLAAGWKGEPVCERLHENAHQRVLRCTFPPGVGHERHYHEPHFGYVISGGRMQITSDGETRVVDIPDGATWTREETFSHEALNVGDTTAIYLIVEPAM